MQNLYDVKIPKRTLHDLKVTENNPYHVRGIAALKRCRDRVKHLLDKFSLRCRTRVSVVTCNGSFWLAEDVMEKSNRFRNLNEAMDFLANPLRPGLPKFENSYRITLSYWNYKRRVLHLFPELIELWWIAYSLDGLPTREGIEEYTAKKQNINYHGNKK